MSAVFLTYLTCGMFIFLLGLVILRENPKQRVNQITGLMMFFAALGPILGAFGLLMERVTLMAEVDLDFFRRLFLMWEFFFPLMLLFALFFPKENPILKRHPKLAYLIFFPHVFHFLVVLIFRVPQDILNLISLEGLEDQFGIILQPIRIILNFTLLILSLFYEFHANFFALVNLIYIIAAIALMYLGYQKLQSPRLKKQVGLVLWGIRASVGLYAVAFLLPRVSPLEVSGNVGHAMTIIALLIGSGAIAWAIVKYQFLDIRLIIRRGIVFSMTSGLVIGIYLLLYGQTKRVVTATLGFDLPILEVMFLILAVIFFQPILGSMEKLVERVFMRNAPDYRVVLQSLSRDILTILDIEKLKDKIVRSLTESMMLENVHLILEGKGEEFTTQVFREGNPGEVGFPKGGEFISLMRSAAEPIGFDETSIRISDRMEIEKLKMLNSYLLIPLIHRSELEGILSLGEKLTRTSFTSEDTTLLNVLSGQIAIALANSKLYQEKLEKQRMEEEISLAREIQRMLLPGECPSGAHFEISAINIPSREVGGDYYDFIRIDEGRIGIAIGDISGKGIPAAMLMSNLQAAFRASAIREQRSSQVMSQVNNQISRTTSSEKYATFFYGIFDCSDLSFSYTNAGHNFPILRKGTGEYRLLKEGELVIGINEGIEYSEQKIQLERGDVVVFYTDGITDALNVEEVEFGEERLLDILVNHFPRSAEELRNRIYDEVHRFTSGVAQYDDMTLVVLRMK